MHVWCAGCRLKTTTDKPLNNIRSLCWVVSVILCRLASTRSLYWLVSVISCLSPVLVNYARRVVPVGVSQPVSSRQYRLTTPVVPVSSRLSSSVVSPVPVNYASCTGVVSPVIRCRLASTGYLRPLYRCRLASHPGVVSPVIPVSSR